MTSFNLSDWALRHRSLVWYFMIAFMAAGLFSYLKLGREEDPEFTIKTMLIQAQWPGASAEEMERQVTIPLEVRRELQIKPGDKLAFIIHEPGNIEVRQADRDGAAREPHRPADRGEAAREAVVAQVAEG